MIENPQIVQLRTADAYSPRRYRLEGGTMSPTWAQAVRPGQRGWCMISVDGCGADQRVVSYGGEVWPTAWPHLFELVDPDAHEFRITEAGLALLDAAAEAA